MQQRLASRLSSALKLAFFAILTAASACGGDDETAHASGAGQKTITVMVYMNADNDLESSALADLKEMMAAQPGGKFNLLVEIDRAEKFSSSPVGGLANFTSTKRLRVEPGKLVELADLGEQNMSDPKTLSGFVAWAAQTAPADRYALVLWDHGGGWTGFGLDNTAPPADLTLSLPELRQGIADGMKAGGVKRFDLLAFDACLMGNFETARMASEFADFFVGSEELVPGHGWDYRALKALADNPGLPTVALGQRVVEAFGAQAKAEKTQAKTTMSLTDLSKLAAVAVAIEALAPKLTGVDLSAARTRLERARQDGLEFGKSPHEAKAAQMVDLASLAEALAAREPTLQGEAKALASAVRQAVIANAAGALYKQAGGLSVFVPSAKKYQAAKALYADAVGADGWSALLKKVHDEAPAIPAAAMPKFSDPEGQAELQLHDDGRIDVRAQLDAGTFAGVTEVEAVFAVHAQGDGGEVLFIGDAAGAVSATGMATASWDGKLLQVLQSGKAPQPVYASAEEVDGYRYVTVPVVYRDGAGGAPIDADLDLLFDASGQEVSRALYLEQDGLWSQTEAQPGSTLTPLLLVAPAPQPGVDPDEPEWLERGAPIDAAAAFSFQFVDVRADTALTTLLFELFAADAEDNFDVAVANADL